MSDFLFKFVPVVLSSVRLGRAWGFTIVRKTCVGGAVYYTASGTRKDGTSNTIAFPTLASAIVWAKGESKYEV